MAVQDPTRIRVLEAAGEEFAEKGFDQATVREICKKAGANVSSINYHFGDKERLYTEAVLEAHRCGSSPLEPSDFERGTPAEQLRRFIQHFLTHVLAVSRCDTWHHTLLLREILRPTAACEAVVREAIRPKFAVLLTILGRIHP
ncbi:MAG: TetR/AcrR family transcriptional regulator, partial [Isosphaeraceae bacterium]